MNVKLDFTRFNGVCEVKYLTSSRSKLYSVKINGKRYVLKVYDRDPQSQVRAREVAVRLRAVENQYLNYYPELKSIIFDGLAVDYGLVEMNSNSYYAALFKYLPGTTLYDAIDNGAIAKWNLTVRKSLIKQSALGVGVFHGLNIVHCDLTPPNLLINKGKLSIIDVDGGGILNSNGEWRIKPLVAGRVIFGIPNAPEVSDGKVEKIGKGLDLWWLAINSFMIATKGINPFFFLKNAEYESLRELKEILEGNVYGWPPPYEIVKKHSMFNPKVKEEHIELVVKEVNKHISSSIFYRAFVDGLDDPSKRPRAREYLFNL